jgi:DNA-binding transcriptional LysR family regulator
MSSARRAASMSAFRAGIVVTPAVRAFTAERPEVTVDVRRLEWDEQEESILSGRVDVAHVRQPITERGLRLWRCSPSADSPPYRPIIRSPSERACPPRIPSGRRGATAPTQSGRKRRSDLSFRSA